MLLSRNEERALCPLPPSVSATTFCGQTKQTRPRPYCTRSHLPPSFPSNHSFPSTHIDSRCSSSPPAFTTGASATIPGERDNRDRKQERAVANVPLDLTALSLPLSLTLLSGGRSPRRAPFSCLMLGTPVRKRDRLVSPQLPLFFLCQVCFLVFGTAASSSPCLQQADPPSPSEQIGSSSGRAPKFTRPA